MTTPKEELATQKQPEMISNENSLSSTEEEIRNWLKNFSFIMSSYGIKLPEDLSNPSEVAKVIRQQAIAEEKKSLKKWVEDYEVEIEKGSYQQDIIYKEHILSHLTQE